MKFSPPWLSPVCPTCTMKDIGQWITTHDCAQFLSSGCTLGGGGDGDGNGNDGGGGDCGGGGCNDGTVFISVLQYGNSVLSRHKTNHALRPMHHCPLATRSCDSCLIL